MPSIFIIPTAHGWNFLRAAEQNGSWNVRKLQTLEEAAPLLAATDDFVLGLPVSAVLAQRFRLPSVDPAGADRAKGERECGFSRRNKERTTC